MTHTPDDATLHAWVDGRLLPERQAEISAWLRAHPLEAERVTAWKHDAQALRTALAGADTSPPNSNLSPARLRIRWREKRGARLALAASVVLALGLGGTLGWHGHALQSEPKPMSDALSAYRLFAEHELALEFTATQQAQLQTWIHRHLGAAGAVPELTAQGWHLTGGRWLSTPEGAAVMLVYEDTQGARVALYMRPKIPHHSTTGERRDGELLARYWLKDNIAFALVGPAEHSPVKRMAALLHGLAHLPVGEGKG